MTTNTIVPEQWGHADAIDAFQKSVFGPGAFTRAAFRLREQGPHDMRVSFVVLNAGDVVASVRMTPVRTSGSMHKGYLLGPLVVSPQWQNAGYGKALVNEAVLAAEARSDADFVTLVGDAPYYAPLGFETSKMGALQLPGPVHPGRLLVRPLRGFDIGTLNGMIAHAGTST